jgi:hypothetical protein
MFGYWVDLDLDASEHAFYYVRVIEIPTPRWTAWNAAIFDVDMRDDIPMKIQERAYTSPIWYTPQAGRVSRDRGGVTLVGQFRARFTDLSQRQSNKWALRDELSGA